MKKLKIYSCTLKDCDKQMISQPFITTNDENAVITVKNAIREEKSILAMALSERIKLYWICDVNPEDFSVENNDNSMKEIFNEIYFRKYAQQIYAENKKKEANEAEAEAVTESVTAEVMAETESAEIMQTFCE